MERSNSKKEQNERELEQIQTYKCKDTVIEVKPVFKKSGKRTLFQSLGQMVQKEMLDS